MPEILSPVEPVFATRAEVTFPPTPEQIERVAALGKSAGRLQCRFVVPGGVIAFIHQVFRE